MPTENFQYVAQFYLGNYSATSNYIKFALTIDGWAVTFGTARRGLGGAV